MLPAGFEPAPSAFFFFIALLKSFINPPTHFRASSGIERPKSLTGLDDGSKTAQSYFVTSYDL